MRTSGRPGRRLVRIAVVCEMAAAALVLLPVTAGAVGPSSSAASYATGATTQPGAAQFSASETLQRTAVVGGQQTISDGPRTFSVSVSQTQDLRNHEVVSVQWSGAHPTGGLIDNQQVAAASGEEYPVVVMECRGVDSPTAAPADQLSPSTCWTATPQERTLNESVSAPLWYLDPYTPAAQRVPAVNFPGPVCFGASSGDQWTVPFDAADGTHYPVGASGCGGIPPDMTVTQAADVLPSDTTYAATDLSGSGSTKFSIETADSLPEVGCSTTVPCSLVIVPIEGADCDPTVAPAGTVVPGSDLQACESPGNLAAGSRNINGQVSPADAVAGYTWFLPSEWKNHISVPLTFAPSAAVCSQGGRSAALSIYGSEVLSQATQQWNPHFCLSPTGFPVTHIQTSEPEAKNLLGSGSIDAAFEAGPPSPGGPSEFPEPTVQAPVALSGFAISYVIDNGDGQPYTDLKLDARLLAKLLTESYPGDRLIQPNEPFYATQPLAIFDDPEFKALNPTLVGLDSITQLQSAPAAVLFNVLGRSDVIRALTSYINADPEARSWLDGTPDPWGMVVNPAYKGIQLPVDQWPLLDSVHTGPEYTQSGNSACLINNPAPVRPLLDQPQPSFNQVGLNLSFGIAPSQYVCPLNGIGLVSLVPYNNGSGLEAVGARFLIGVVPLAMADQYGLESAALESYRDPNAPVKFSDPSDRIFQSPTLAALQAAAALLQPDKSSGSWLMPYSDFPTDSTSASAYPGALLASIDVPTKGLATTDASELSQYLSFLISGGQTPGYAVGQLPPGYLPLTAANHLGNELTYSRAAIADIKAQNGEIPPLVPSAPGGPAQPPKAPPRTVAPPTTVAADNANTSGSFGSAPIPVTGGGQDSSGSAAVGSAGAVASAGGVADSRFAPASASSKSAGPSTGGTSEQPQLPTGTTAGYSSGLGQVALPIALVLALLGGLIGATPRIGTLTRRRR